jgi:hypothetical protein
VVTRSVRRDRQLLPSFALQLDRELTQPTLILIVMLERSAVVCWVLDGMGLVGVAGICEGEGERMV